MDVAPLKKQVEKNEISQLPLFKNLSPDHIHVFQHLAECLPFQKELYQASVLGFDSESKPTFTKGEISTGPHLIQLATLEKAYLFQVNQETLKFLKPILNHPTQLKVGFGLKNDAHLFRKREIELNNILDLSKCFASFGFKNAIGVKNAMALLFNVNFPKSKSISTSNWSKKQLSSQQIAYAAADAYAAALIFNELQQLGRLTDKLKPNCESQSLSK